MTMVISAGLPFHQISSRSGRPCGRHAESRIGRVHSSDSTDALKSTSMAEPQQENEKGLTFIQSKAEPTSWMPWAVAGVAILVGLGLLIAFGGHRSSAPLGS